MASKPKIPPIQSPMRHTWRNKKKFLGHVASILEESKSITTPQRSCCLYSPVPGFFTPGFLLQLKTCSHFPPLPFISRHMLYAKNICPRDYFDLLGVAACSQIPAWKVQLTVQPVSQRLQATYISFRVIQGRESQQMKTRLVLPCQDNGMELLNEVLSREIHSCFTININIEAAFKVWTGELKCMEQ